MWYAIHTEGRKGKIFTEQLGPSQICLHSPFDKKEHEYREPAGGAFVPDTKRGESSNRKPCPLVMWPYSGETLTQTLSLPALPTSLTHHPGKHRARGSSYVCSMNNRPSWTLLTCWGLNLAYSKVTPWANIFQHKHQNGATQQTRHKSKTLH